MGQGAIEPAGGDGYYCEELNAAAEIEPPVLGRMGEEAGPPGVWG